MKEIRTFTGVIVRKHKTFWDKYILTFSDAKHTVKAKCGEGLYNCLSEGIHLTITLHGDQIVGYTAPADKGRTRSCSNAETSAYQHGKPLYCRSSRCMNTPELQAFNQGLLTGAELVSFDGNLFEHRPVQPGEIEIPHCEHQYLAFVVDPQPQPSPEIARDGRFTFCGYDLVEAATQISAIIDCGAAFREAIPYEQLNDFGLFTTYAAAKQTQAALRSTYPNEEHADCVIVEIWRYITA